MRFNFLPFVHQSYTHQMAMAFMEVAIALLIAVMLVLIENFIYKRLYPHLIKSHRSWDDTLLRAIHLPIKLVIAAWTLSFVMVIGRNYLPNFTLFHYAVPIRNIGIVLAIVWFLLRYIRLLETKIVTQSGRKTLDKSSVHAAGKILQVLVVLVASLMLLQILGIPISGLLAFGGGGAIVAGLASKDMLANAFSGFMIYLDRPFTVGDWIRSPDKEIEGTVEYVGWRLTRIRTFDKRPLYVPNSTFSTVSIENPSRMTNRRIKATLGLRYEDASKVREIVAAIERMLRNHSEIDTQATLFVRLVNLNTFTLDILVYTFTKTTEWLKFQEVQEDVLLKIMEIVAQHGADFAFPTNTIEVPKGISLLQGE